MHLALEVVLYYDKNVLSNSTKLILRCKLLSDSLNCQEPDDTYQCGFQQDEGYDMRLKRDDRRHQKGRGLDIHGEVKTKQTKKNFI